MLYSIARKILFSMDPETAHSVIMSNLDWAVNLGLTKLVTRDPPTNSWNPYIKNFKTIYTDANCYESLMHFPTDVKLLRERIE